MNTPRTLILALFATCIAGAQENPAPAPPATDAPAAPAQTDMEKWIATTDAQWQAAYKRDVTEVHESERQQGEAAIPHLDQTAITKASGASDLEGSVALRNEQKRFGDTNVFLEQDDPGDPASVKQLRAAVRIQGEA